MLHLLVKNPTVPQAEQPLWMLPVTHQPLFTLHNIALEGVLAQVEASLLIQTSLRKLRGWTHARDVHGGCPFLDG